MKHRTNVFLPWLLAVGASIAMLASCQGGDPHASAQPAGARCANCGMRVSPDDTWRASLTTSSGEALSFDAPKCMFRVLRGERGQGARDPRVIEYYSSEPRPASSLFYVIGSDLQSPMGRDLVPIDGRERAERFLRDHHGDRVLSFDEVTAAVVETLFRRAH